MSERKLCPECDGEGRSKSGKQVCGNCDGTGHIVTLSETGPPPDGDTGGSGQP